VFCTNCGHQNPADANFCASCGHQLEHREDATITFQAIDLGDTQSEDDILAEASQLTDGDAMLYVKRGTNVGATYLLDTDVVRAGRQPDNDVFLDDVTVSRRHAEFHREDGGFGLRDVGSLNGTYVNGKQVDDVELVHGDEVQIGKFKLVFLTGLADHPHSEHQPSDDHPEN
jgi:pSer/pThr/pTyr-binding forkhead associated (FHA) protein